jgi:hypothetical protein
MDMNWCVIVSTEEFNATVLEQEFYALETDARLAAKNYTESTGEEACVAWIRGRYIPPQARKSEWQDSQ